MGPRNFPFSFFHIFKISSVITSEVGSGSLIIGSKNAEINMYPPICCFFMSSKICQQIGGNKSEDTLMKCYFRSLAHAVSRAKLYRIISIIRRINVEFVLISFFVREFIFRDEKFSRMFYRILSVRDVPVSLTHRDHITTVSLISSLAGLIFWLSFGCKRFESKI